MDDDALILRQFANANAHDAFAHLVARHVHVVYSACLRQLKDPAQADRACSAAFVMLAREAGRLQRERSVVPWLLERAAALCAVAAAAATRGGTAADRGAGGRADGAAAAAA